MAAEEERIICEQCEFTLYLMEIIGFVGNIEDDLFEDYILQMVNIATEADPRLLDVLHERTNSMKRLIKKTCESFFD